MQIAQLLDQARARSAIPSDYAIAQRLGVGRQLVSDWRTGRSYPGQLALFRLADLAGRNPAEVVAELELERAERAGKLDQVGAWRDMLQKLGGVAASVVAAVSLSGVPAPSIASIGAASQPAGHASQPIHRVLLNR